jgi:uncharacterized protein
MDDFTVIKRDHTGTVRLTYPGKVIERGATWVCVEAPFTFDRVDLGVVVLVRGDIFTEFHYTDRWYNIFQINSCDDGHLKGWYCNIARPAVITGDTVAADDLALDVFVKPNGEIVLLDEDEFEALNLSSGERATALSAVGMIEQAVAGRAAPFDRIS